MFLITNYTEFPELVERAENNTFTYEPGVIVLNLLELPPEFEYVRSRLDEGSGFTVGNVRYKTEPKKKRAKKAVTVETETVAEPEKVYPTLTKIVTKSLDIDDAGYRIKRTLEGTPVEEAIKFFKEVWDNYGRYPVFTNSTNIMMESMPKIEKGVPVMLIAASPSQASGIISRGKDKWGKYTVNSTACTQYEDRVLFGNNGAVAQANKDMSIVYLSDPPVAAKEFYTFVLEVLQALSTVPIEEKTITGADKVIKPMIDKSIKEAEAIEIRLNDDISNFTKQLFEAHKVFEKLMATKERLFRSTEDQIGLLTSELEKVATYPDIASIYIVNKLIVFETKAMWAKLTEDKFLLGRFKISLNLSTGEIMIRNLDFMNCGKDYPHQLHYGNICWGSNAGELSKLIAGMHVAAAIDFICAFISAPNTKDSAGAYALRSPKDRNGKFHMADKNAILILNDMIGEGKSVEEYNAIYA